MDTPSILDLSNTLKLHNSDRRTLKAVKCSCKKSWCTVCSINTVIIPLITSIKDWDYRYVRMVTLTVDRNQFNHNPELAYDELTERKAVPRMIANLRRTAGIDIVDWARIIEWHKDEFPHWHLIIHVGQAGKSGQIGEENLRKYWPYGWVREDYFETETDYQRFCNYFKKHRYINDGKSENHQITLPDWARKRESVIRRVSRKNGKNNNKKQLSYKSDRPLNRTGHKPTQGERLDKCGQAVDLYADDSFQSYIGRVNIPYADFKVLAKVYGAWYEPGLGLVIERSKIHPFLEDLEKMIKKSGSN